MKRISYIVLFLLAFVSVDAQNVLNGLVIVDSVHVARNAERLFLSLNLDISDLEVSSEEEVILTPKLVTPTDTLYLSSVVIAGRNRFYRLLRNDADLENVDLYRAGKFQNVDYQAVVPFAKWMENANIVMNEEICGCVCELLYDDESLLTTLDFAPKMFVPQFVYVAPQAEAVKTREVKGSAFIDFPVNRTEIYENYRNNPSELQKIRTTIDVVKNDPDTRITSVHIKGYASPEGSYANNIRLAKGRTETLMHYVQRLYDFPASTMATEFEPEDWEGLRKYVEESSMLNKEALLAIINSDREADNKDWTLKQRYPEDYRFLLANVYPALRHSDYTVEYVVRAYTDIEEAKRVMWTAPGKLSLQEFYMVANSYPVGSEEYNEVFDTMVRLYPNDEVANLNAANTAMNRKDWASARKYLAKAGNGPHALYAQGVMAAMQKDYELATRYFTKARDNGVKEAENALNQIKKITK